MRRIAIVVLLACIAPAEASPQEGIQIEISGDSVSFWFVDADLRTAIHALAGALDRPLVFGQLGEHRITLHMPTPVRRSVIPELLRGLLPQFGLVLTEQPDYYLVGPPLVAQDQGTPHGEEDLQLFVIEIRHARAEDVAATVSALYGQPYAFGERPRPRPTVAEALRGHLVPPADVDVPEGARVLTEQTAVLSGDVRIIPDPRTNTLLVRASRADFELIQAAVRQLDVRPLQVLIEVLIAEVRRDRSLAFGTGLAVGPSAIPGHPATELAVTTPTAGLGDFVLSILHLGRVDLAVTLSAAASRGDVAILSRPVLLAANNESAEILVGSQRPFVQVQRALPTDAPVRDQVVQFKDVGTRLTVVPTVSQDGYVMLQVIQEVSAATAEVAFDAPVLSTRSIQTRLLIRDGHTAVLGGLTDRQKDITRAGVPVLMNVPILGGLFGRQSVRTTETELFVFLTPTVLRNDEDLDEASRSAGDRTRRLREPRAPIPERP